MWPTVQERRDAVVVRIERIKSRGVNSTIRKARLERLERALAILDERILRGGGDFRNCEINLRNCEINVKSIERRLAWNAQQQEILSREKEELEKALAEIVSEEAQG